MIAASDALASLERDEFDLVVIGGGITGAGVALDAATRGYSVALVEEPTSPPAPRAARRSSSTAGCATCRTSTSGLVREALLERSILVKLAPHLVRPLPLLVPTLRGQAPRPHARAWG